MMFHQMMEEVTNAITNGEEKQKILDALLDVEAELNSPPNTED